jgi:hypothetical protein
MEHREATQTRIHEFDASKAPIESINVGRKCGRVIVTASENLINVWSVGKRDPLFHFTNPQKVLWADFDPREQYIVSVDESSIKLWDLEQNGVARTLDFSSKIKMSATKRDNLAYHPFAHIIAVRFEDTPVQIWDLKSRMLLQTMPESIGSGPITFSPDGRWICAVNNTSVSVWDICTAQVVFTQQLSTAISSAVFSPTQIALVLATQSGAVEVWDLVNNKQLSETVQEAHAEAITSLAFNPEGSLIVGMTASGVKAFEWPSGQCVDQITVDHDEWKTISGFTRVPNSPYLIGCAARENNSAAWVVDTSKFMSESANETADASVADDFAVNNSQDETSQDEEVSAAGTSKDTRGNDNIAEDLLEESYEVYANLTTRATNLRALRSLWSSRGSVKSCLEMINRSNDSFILHDIIHNDILSVTRSELTVEDCLLLLHQLKLLLGSQVDDHILSSLRMLKEMVKTHGAAIKSGKEAMMNLSEDDKQTQARNMSFYENFVGIRRLLLQLKKKSGGVSTASKELSDDINTAISA